MIAQFRWNEADLVSAQKVWLRRHPGAHLRGYWFPVAVAVLSVAVLVFKPEAGIASLVGIALALLLFGVSALRTRWRWHRQFKRSALGHDEVTAKVDKHGLDLHSQSYDVYHSWGECSDIYESEGVIIFETANGSFVFLPKRDLSHAQLLDLRNTIVTYARVQPSLASQPA
jgi:YcxB-like protein